MDGPGGSGKTFTYNCLATEMHAKDHKVLTAAWTGIAATLLSCGRTVHSLFKLPVSLYLTPPVATLHQIQIMLQC